MQRAAIFVAPAVYEPFGLTVLEAASAGCALVLADIPSFRELWQGAALFVPPNDRNALFDALQQMSRNEMARRTLQQRAVLRARRYGASDMVKGYRRAYHALPRAARPHAETSRYHSAEAIS